MIGSKAMSGKVNNDAAYYRPDGTNIQTCFRNELGVTKSHQQSRRNPEDMVTFVELQLSKVPFLESLWQADWCC